jgi:hypothetical protein
MGFRDRLLTPAGARAVITRPARSSPPAWSPPAGSRRVSPCRSRGPGSGWRPTSGPRSRSCRRDRSAPRSARRRCASRGAGSSRRPSTPATGSTGRWRRPGPVRCADRLGEIADRVAQGVDESWRIASTARRSRTRCKQLEPLARSKAVADRGRELSGGAAADDRSCRTADALQSQIASTRRIGKVARETRDRLRLLDARLDESVARAVELSLRAGDVAEIGGLDDDVESIVTEMETLRVALEETAATA